MKLQDRIDAFVALGDKLRTLDEETASMLTRRANDGNGWFDNNTVSNAITGITKMLERDVLNKWVTKYPSTNDATPQRVLIVMAGNIPAVGFHDALCTLITGNILMAKLSSSDTFLMTILFTWLKEIEPRFNDKIVILDAPIKEIDKVIATGSDNSSRYFVKYFDKYPNIIRQNRSSIAVVRGDESKEALTKLTSDIFLYYGLGCRNISKIYTPKGYDHTLLMAALEDAAKETIINHKYANNYDYNKSIYLINKVKHLDNGGLILTESTEMVSPISVLYYETYENGQDLKDKIDQNKEKIQCIVTEGRWLANSEDFGLAQFPTVDTYADEIDTMEFLSPILA
ncbi:acyl-CoA reductase [Flammeovirga pectinis]|uniref:Acyl-CoA reductase n=1 Tax=Flammeovirga pectinis TaxID=2494373 RepID=A0A3S9P1F1_9BACT|nr:acyl-CoA reductase [Flammeovirga pectinis]AZQ61990.1 acyl-CoA reductase [Flammeovirga pectinis]